MTRTARSAWNYATVALFSAISMAVALVVTPVLLHYLGEARLGAVKAVQDWIGYLSLLELGLGGAMLPLLARELTKDGHRGVGVMMAAGFRGYLKVTAAMVAGGLLLVVVVTRLVRIDPAFQHDLRLAMLIGILPLATVPLAPLRLLIEADQRGYAVNLLLIVQNLTVAGMSVLLARVGWGIHGQTTALAIGAGVFGTLLVIDALRHYRRLLNVGRAADPAARDAGEEIWRLNTPTLINNACARVGLLTDNILIGGILSAPAIVPFFLTQRLAQLAQAQLQALGTATWAGMAQLHAQGEHALFRERLVELTRLTVVLGAMVLVPILVYNPRFVLLWVGPAQFAGMTLTAISVINALLLSVTALWGWAFSATGQIARLVPLLVTSAAVNLLVSVGFTAWYAHRDPHRALLGPVLGTLVAYAGLNLPVLPALLARHFNVSVRDLITAVAAPLLVAVPYGVVLAGIARMDPPTGWPTLAAHMALAAAGFGVLAWGILLTRADRELWKLRMRLAIGRRAAA